MLSNKTTGKRYIGQTKSHLSSGRRTGVDYRWKTHVKSALKGGTTALQEAIQDYGDDDFDIEVLVICNVDMLDYYEVGYIEMFNTLIPNGYNIQPGGNANKTASAATRELISRRLRFLYVSEEDRIKIEASMQEIGITELPYGINYVHNTNREREEGFNVSIGDGKKKTFQFVKFTLTENLRLALEYHGYYTDNDVANMKRMDDEMEQRIKLRISEFKRFLHVSEEDRANIEASMKELNITEIPQGIVYSHNTNKETWEGFVVKLDNKKTKTYRGSKTLTDNLRLALEYQQAYTNKNEEVMNRIDEEIKMWLQIRTRITRYTPDVFEVIKQYGITRLDIPYSVHYHTKPHP